MESGRVAQTIFSQHTYGTVNIQDGRVHMGDVYNVGVWQLDPAQIQKERLLKSLRFEGMYQRHANIEHPHTGTFEWIFNNNSENSFSKWLVDGNGIFLLEGKAGSGKSTLMKFIIDHSQTTTLLADRGISGVILNFFFWLSGTEAQCCMKGCLASLLFQALSNITDIDIIFKDYAKIATKFELHDWSVDELCYVFRKAIQLIKRSTVIFVDGLDELSAKHDDELRKLLDFVDGFRNSKQVKFCLSSRPIGRLENRFGVNLKVRLQDLTMNDIRTYVEDRIEDDCQKLLYVVPSDEELARITSLLCDRADGVFLWVHTVLCNLSSGLADCDSVQVLYTMLDELPSGMEELYTNMWERQKGKPRAYRAEASSILAWSLRFPMSVFELAIARDRAMQERYLTTFEPQIEPKMLNLCERLRRNVLQLCVGLLEITDWSGGSLERNQDLDKTYERTPKNYLRAISIEVGQDRLNNFLQRSSLHTATDLIQYDRLSVYFSHRCARDFLLNTADGINIVNSSFASDETYAQTRSTAELARMVEQMAKVQCDSFRTFQDSNLFKHINGLPMLPQKFVEGLYGTGLKYNWAFYLGTSRSRFDCVHIGLDSAAAMEEEFSKFITEHDQNLPSKYYLASLICRDPTPESGDRQSRFIEWLLKNDIDLLTPHAYYVQHLFEPGSTYSPVCIDDPIIFLVYRFYGYCGIRLQVDQQSIRKLGAQLHESKAKGRTLACLQDMFWVPSPVGFAHTFHGGSITLEVDRTDAHKLAFLALCIAWPEFYETCHDLLNADDFEIEGKVVWCYFPDLRDSEEDEQESSGELQMRGSIPTEQESEEIMQDLKQFVRASISLLLSGEWHKRELQQGLPGLSGVAYELSMRGDCNYFEFLESCEYIPPYNAFLVPLDPYEEVSEDTWEEKGNLREYFRLEGRDWSAKKGDENRKARPKPW